MTYLLPVYCHGDGNGSPKETYKLTDSNLLYFWDSLWIDQCQGDTTLRLFWNDRHSEYPMKSILFGIFWIVKSYYLVTLQIPPKHSKSTNILWFGVATVSRKSRLREWSSKSTHFLSAVHFRGFRWCRMQWLGATQWHYNRLGGSKLLCAMGS